MKPPLRRAIEFNADFDGHYRWYLEQAGEDVAERFLEAVKRNLRRLSEQPGLGGRRKF